MKEQTPEEERRAIESIGTIVTAIADSIKKDNKLFIGEMVTAMKVQADIISRARAKGIDIADLMEEIKAAYFLSNKPK